ncbi:MAG: serine/threonine-protein kinase [Myxococcota bacterium]
MRDTICPDCLARVAADAEACRSCGLAQPEGGWSEDLLLGMVVGERYKLEKRLGEGGMGTVYRAHRTGRLGGEVAIKVLSPALSKTVAAKRFEREARVVGQLSSPHIVRVHDFDQFVWPRTGQTLYYLAMELVRGSTLGALMAGGGQLNFLWVIDILRQTALGLDEAHKAGIVHRDLKPANLMVVQQHGATHVKILDFGVAGLFATEGERSESDLERLTRTGYITGTPDYMAPEQALGRNDVGPAADMYSLGVIAWRMLAGTLPFTGQTTMEVLTRRVAEDAPPLATVCPPPALPPSVYAMVDRLLARRPADRYPNAAALLDDLAAFPVVDAAPDVMPDPTHLERAAVLTPASLMAQTGVQQDAPTGEATGSPPSLSDEPSLKQSRAGLVIALLALVLVAGGGLFAWYHLSQRGDDAPTTENAAAAQPAPTVGSPTTPALAEADPPAEAPPEIPLPEPIALPAALAGPRPPLPAPFGEAWTADLSGVTVQIALADPRPSADAELPLLITVGRGSEVTRLAAVTLAAGDADEARARGRDDDGRALIALPAAKGLAARPFVLTAVLADGDYRRLALSYDPASGRLSPPR